MRLLSGGYHMPQWQPNRIDPNNLYWVFLLRMASMASFPSEWEIVWISICGGSPKRLFVPSKTLNLSDRI
jgi:hypothetical protein